MAAIKKYAGLPDLDLEQEEIYETQVPELTEASTLPTESTDGSDDDNPDFDRRGLNPDAARARFEPAIVDASHTNFSDAIDGGRRDYQTRTRRRRRRVGVVEGHRDEYESVDAEDETLQGRLARLQREAAELQAEIDRIEKKGTDKDEDDEDSDYEDTVDHHDQSQNDAELARGVQQLTKTLDAVTVASRRQKGVTIEEEFLRNLSRDNSKQPSKSQTTVTQQDQLPQSSISAIAAFSDRLTTLESLLGLPPISQSTTITSPMSVIPTLDNLTTQIETLYSTLSPRPEHHVQLADPRHAASNPQPTSTVHLDPIAAKIRYLISESKRLEESRKAATKSFEDLLEARDRHAHLFNHSHTAVHSGTDARLSRNLASPTNEGSRPGSGGQQDSGSSMTKKEDMQQQFTSLFLDDQAAKITALFNLLPTIQSLQPLLPVVLERLRALSVLHSGAADVKGEMDEIERRLEAQEEEIEKWREGVEGVEKSMAEGREVIKENVTVIGEAIRRLGGEITELKR